MLQRLPSIPRALVALVAGGGCAGAQAAEWALEPAFSWAVDHDSNRRLAVGGEQSDQGHWLTADAKLRRTNDADEVILQPHLELQRFSGNARLDSNNGSLLVSAAHHGELATLTASGSYARDSTLTTELIDTGIVDSSSSRETRSGSVSIVRNFSARQQVEVDGGYAKVGYPGGQRLGLFGYRSPSVAASYLFGLSPRLNVGVTGFGSEVTAPITHYDSRDLGVRWSAEQAVSAQLKITASAGLNHTSVLARHSSGGVWALKAARTGQRTQWTLSYDHSAQPSGSGTLVLRDTLGVFATHSVSTRVSTTLSVNAVRNRDLSGGLAYDNRRYLSSDIGLEWRPRLQWTWDLTAGTSQARTGPIEDTARGWRVRLLLRWTPRPLTKSR